MLSQIFSGFMSIPLKFQSHVFSPDLPVIYRVFNCRITDFVGADQFIDTTL